MKRYAAIVLCVALAISFNAIAALPADARVMPPVPPLSDDAECWYGELYGIESLICRETDGKLYRCRVARTECWHAIPPGPYTRGSRVNAIAGAATRTTR